MVGTERTDELRETRTDRQADRQTDRQTDGRGAMLYAAS